MGGMMRLIVIATLVLLSAMAAVPAHAERRVALVVGNAAYPDAPLGNPITDTGLVAPWLDELGFEVTRVTDADIDALDAAFDAFVETADGADMAVFYFAGHGFAMSAGRGDQLGVRNYLMATSARFDGASESQLRRHGLVLEEVIASLTAAAKTSLIFVDACRNEPGVRSPGGSGRGFSSVDIAANGDVFVGLSTRLGDVADDGTPGQGSPFAQAFVAHMATPGLDVTVAFNEVRKEVTRVSGGRQKPELNRIDLTDPRGVVLAPAVAADPREQQAALAWELVATSTETATVRRFKELYAGTSFAALAETRLLELESSGTGEDDAPLDGEPRPEAASVIFAARNGVGITECDRFAASEEAHIAGVSGVDIDSARILRQGLEPCLAAVRDYPDEPRFLFQLGRVYRGLGDDARTVEMYRVATDMGFAPAKAALGARYLLGLGVVQDTTRGRQLLEESAASASPMAFRYMGLMHRDGLGVPQNTTAALEWYERSAAAGNASAMWDLGAIYQKGELVPANPELAFEWFSKAAEAGDPDGMDSVASAYRNGTGAAKNPELAERWYRQAIEKGRRGSLYSLAYMHAFGELGPADPEAAGALLFEALTVAEPTAVEQFRTNPEAFTPEVRKVVQQHMLQAGVYNGPVDGVLGPLTSAAIDQLVARWTSPLTTEPSGEPGTAATTPAGTVPCLQTSVPARFYSSVVSQLTEAPAPGVTFLCLDGPALFHLATLHAGDGQSYDIGPAASYLYEALKRGDASAQALLRDQAGAGLSADIRVEFQKILAMKGLYKGTIDGEFGPSTLSAVAALAAGSQTQGSTDGTSADDTRSGCVGLPGGRIVCPAAQP